MHVQSSAYCTDTQKHENKQTLSVYVQTQRHPGKYDCRHTNTLSAPRSRIQLCSLLLSFSHLVCVLYLIWSQFHLNVYLHALTLVTSILLLFIYGSDVCLVCCSTVNQVNLANQKGAAEAHFDKYGL